MPSPTTIGGYALGELLGRGGMGTVYRAHQASLDRTVAIKLLHPQLAADPRLAARFRTEAVAGGRLAHPHIARVLDYGTSAEGTSFIAMEHVSGERLSLTLEREGAFAPRRACALIRQLLSALETAHAAGVVHADVKSDNLIRGLGPDGREMVTLIDFGIARLSDHPLPLETDERTLSGTPEYLAPEVIQGEAPTPASDLYATGVLLYELLTGATPFRDDAPTAIFQHHLEDDAVPPSLRCPEAGIPPALDRAVLRALAKAPAQRYGSADAFARAIAEAWPADGERRAVAAPAIPDPDESRLTVRRLAVSVELPTMDWPITPRKRLAEGTRPSPLDRIDALRAAVGDAITAGDPQAIAARYLELARGLVAAHQVDLATWELEQGVDVLTGGEGPEALQPPRDLWHVLLALAGIYAGQGDRIRAHTAAQQARTAAGRVRSPIGRARARAFLQRLGLEAARNPHSSVACKSNS